MELKTNTERWMTVLAESTSRRRGMTGRVEREQSGGVVLDIPGAPAVLLFWPSEVREASAVEIEFARRIRFAENLGYPNARELLLAEQERAAYSMAEAYVELARLKARYESLRASLGVQA